MANNGGEVIRFGRCMKNHVAIEGDYIIDGCGEFVPSEGGGRASLLCEACGCHRSFHLHPSTPPLIPHLAMSLQYQHAMHHQASQQGAMQPHRHAGMVTVALPPPRAQNLVAPSPPPPVQNPVAPPPSPPVQNPVAPPSPPPLQIIAPPPPPPQNLIAPQGVIEINDDDDLPRRAPRIRLTEEQKARMRAFADHIGWSIQRHNEHALLAFCAEIGIDRNRFRFWMYRHKAMLAATSSNVTTSAPSISDKTTSTPSISDRSTG